MLNLSRDWRIYPVQEWIDIPAVFVLFPLVEHTIFEINFVFFRNILKNLKEPLEMSKEPEGFRYPGWETLVWTFAPLTPLMPNN